MTYRLVVLGRVLGGFAAAFVCGFRVPLHDRTSTTLGVGVLSLMLASIPSKAFFERAGKSYGVNSPWVQFANINLRRVSAHRQST